MIKIFNSIIILILLNFPVLASPNGLPSEFSFNSSFSTPQPKVNSKSNMNFKFVFGGSWLSANLGADRPQGAPHLWCGYAMRLEVQAMGYDDPGSAYDGARTWCNWGNKAAPGSIGSIMVTHGHVSKVIGECGVGEVQTISGNATGRKVAIMCERIASAICWRH